MSRLQGTPILLGISGGIAAYKAAELTRLLIRSGATVQIVMTENAQHFISPLTLQVLSEQPVCKDLFDLSMEAEVGHIQVAKRARLAIVAPATANIIAKMASGIADDYLSTVLLAVTAPVLVCPAMNSKMYEHPATQRNLDILRQWGHFVLEPDCGTLACKDEGPGRLPDPAAIVEAAKRALTPQTLKGRNLLVSAGPTWEPFDPVRFITNPSSGKMGYALAAEATRRGGRVHLVTGPSELTPASGLQCHKVTTAQQMCDTILELAPNMDIIIMAAAVGDYRPAETAPQKLKKGSGPMTAILERTPDILANLGSAKRDRQVLVGFAAETENLIENAGEKLRRKNLDFIVANDLTQAGAGFRCDTNQVQVISRNGRVEALPCMTKAEVASNILDRTEKALDLFTDPLAIQV